MGKVIEWFNKGERGKEHAKDREKWDKGSHMLKHIVLEHSFQILTTQLSDSHLAMPCLDKF